VVTPASIPLRILAAQVAVAAGDVARAEQLLVEAIQADTTVVEAYAMLGRLYLSQKRLDQARAKFEDLLKRQPRSVAALTMVGIVLQAQNQPAEAQRRYEQALELDAHAPVAAANLAALLAEHGGNLDVALQLAQTAKEQLPASSQVDDTVGWIYVKKGLASLAIPPCAGRLGSTCSRVRGAGTRCA
jgi:Tfp pilus assembly protein PilF